MYAIHRNAVIAWKLGGAQSLDSVPDASQSIPIAEG